MKCIYLFALVATATALKHFEGEVLFTKTFRASSRAFQFFFFFSLVKHRHGISSDYFVYDKSEKKLVSKIDWNHGNRIRCFNDKCFHYTNFNSNPIYLKQKIISKMFSNSFDSHCSFEFVTSKMKFLNFLTSDTSYKVGVFSLKLCGFGFFTVKRSINGLKYHQSVFDVAVFLVSISFSLSLLMLERNRDLRLEVKSVILNAGTSILFKLSLLSIVVTKCINMFWSRKFFNVLKILARIDKKVWETFKRSLKLFNRHSLVIRWLPPESNQIPSNCF